MLSWTAFGVGTIMLIGSLVEFVRLADKQQRLGFARSAELLRGVAVAEVAVVILTVALVIRTAGIASRVPIIGGLVLLVGIVNVIFSAQAGVIP